jgi:hypothetical protein
MALIRTALDLPASGMGEFSHFVGSKLISRTWCPPGGMTSQSGAFLVHARFRFVTATVRPASSVTSNERLS